MARKAKRATLPKEAKEFAEEVIQIDRVTRVVKGGRRMRFRATVVIGDRNGRVGLGVGKSNEVQAAISKAITQAKKTVLRVPLINDTIPHDIQYKFKAAKIKMMPAGPGTGLIVGGAMRKVVDLAGIKNLLAKSIGTSNKLAAARATYNALALLKENPFIKKVEKKEDVVVVKEEQELGESTPKSKVVKAQKAEKTASSEKSQAKPEAKKVAKEEVTPEVKSETEQSAQ